MARPKKKPEDILENLSMRVNPDIYAEIEAIAAKHDRPISYIARKLAMRGLVQYRKDGLLDTFESESGESGARQPKKKKKDIGPLGEVGFRIIGIGHGNVLDPTNKKKVAPPVEEQAGKKKGPRNEG